MYQLTKTKHCLSNYRWYFIIDSTAFYKWYFRHRIVRLSSYIRFRLNRFTSKGVKKIEKNNVVGLQYN